MLAKRINKNLSLCKSIVWLLVDEFFLFVFDEYVFNHKS